MLGTLLKHEWKESWKVPSILIGTLMVLSLMAGSVFAYPAWESELRGLDILLVLLVMMFYFSIIAVSVGISLYIAIRFYKSMFTDEGYLTHTLPVKTHELLLSKVLIMSLWILISGAAIIASLVIFGLMAVFFLVPDFSAIKRLLEEAQLLDGRTSLHFLASLTFMAICSILSGTMMIVGSVSIGQMVKKHKVLGSIGAYFAISTVIQIVMMIVVMPVIFISMERMNTATDPNSVFAVLEPVYWVAGILSIAFSIGMYFLSEYLIRKKLNLD